jgi:alkylation response protein AidB-like acyl-CoA dehydrogenase
MDFAFTEEQEALRELARGICQDHATHERLKAVERDPDAIDRELWRALAGANLLGVTLPERAGGSALGLVELCLLLEQAGAAVAPVPLWPALALAGLPLARFGTPAQHDRWLRPLAAGDAVLTAALVELPEEDAAAPRTRAVRDGAGWRLDGTKDCVPAAHVAAAILVPARTGDGRVGVFLLEPGTPGVTLERQVATNREVQARLRLEGARVGADAALGDPLGGGVIVDWLVERALLGLCALELGVVERALRITAQYTTERRQFDRPIGSFQAVQQRAADAWIDVEAIRLTTWQAAWRLDAGLPAADAVRIAKFWAADAGHRVVYAAQHLHGGIGVDVDYPIHRYYLWSKTLELTLGSGARQLAALGESIAGAP